jgi:hypothetical protein
MPTRFITLPRSELYELVWSKPVTEVAKEFGISDEALASLRPLQEDRARHWAGLESLANSQTSLRYGFTTVTYQVL